MGSQLLQYFVGSAARGGGWLEGYIKGTLSFAMDKVESARGVLEKRYSVSGVRDNTGSSIEEGGREYNIIIGRKELALGSVEDSCRTRVQLYETGLAWSWIDPLRNLSPSSH